MTSEITAFRDQIIEHLRTHVPDLKSVDWYDGLFDETDVDEWVVEAPAAYVAAVSIPKNDPHQTGEMNACLRIIVTVVTEDKWSARDNDAQNWGLMEQIAVVANQSRFGVPDAAPATTPMLKRLRDPGLRREGIALGVVEWDSGYTFGRNRTFETLFAYDPKTGERIVKTPTMNAFLGIGTIKTLKGESTQSVSLRRPDDASPFLDEDDV